MTIPGLFEYFQGLEFETLKFKEQWVPCIMLIIYYLYISGKQKQNPGETIRKIEYNKPVLTAITNATTKQTSNIREKQKKL